MPKARVKEIAAMGGKAAHRKGTAHEWTPKEARAAGERGGRMTQAARIARARKES